MYHLKLIKSLSYHGIVKATKENPDVYTDDEAVANAAVATGFFELVATPAQEDAQPSLEPEAEPEESEQGKTLEEMTVSEIETFATYHGVSLKGINTKAKKIARLRETLGDKAAGAVTYGSPTMVELEENN